MPVDEDVQRMVQQALGMAPLEQSMAVRRELRRGGAGLELELRCVLSVASVAQVELRLELEPCGNDDRPVVWIAGGVGATPFLAAAATTRPEGTPVPTMLYAVRSTEDNPMLDRLLEAEADGRLNLVLYTPDTGRMTADDLDRYFPDGMAGHHVALCGPTGLVNEMAEGARQRGATAIETEEFDMRQGFGPDRSLEIDRFLRRRPRLAKV